MRLGAETVEQINLMAWLSTMPDVYPYVLHIPNERQCTSQQGRILKRMGVKSGVSDLFIAIPKEGYHGMWLELKAPKGKLSDNQMKFMRDMSEQGYLAVCSMGFEVAKKAILEYLQKPSA